MKKRFLLAIAIAFLATSSALAQGPEHITQVFVTHVPAIGPVIDLSQTFVDTHTLEWRIDGSPTTCAVQVDGSFDGKNWVAAQVIASQICTANGEFNQFPSSVNFVRIDVTALSPGATGVFIYRGSSGVSTWSLALGAKAADRNVADLEIRDLRDHKPRMPDLPSLPEAAIIEWRGYAKQGS